MNAEYSIDKEFYAKIKEYWNDISNTVNNEFIDYFIHIPEYDLADEYTNIVSQICSDMFRPKAALYELYRENNIVSDDLMKYYTIKIWHRELIEAFFAQLDDDLKQGVIDMWKDHRDNLFISSSFLDIFYTTPVSELSRYNISIGLYIRNRIIQTDKKLCERFTEHNVTDADDMSLYIMRIWHQALHQGKIK